MSSTTKSLSEKTTLLFTYYSSEIIITYQVQQDRYKHVLLEKRHSFLKVTVAKHPGKLQTTAIGETAIMDGTWNCWHINISTIFFLSTHTCAHTHTRTYTHIMLITTQINWPLRIFVPEGFSARKIYFPHSLPSLHRKPCLAAGRFG